MNTPSPLPGKPVSVSAVTEQVYRVFPNDLNSHDTVFGGLIMALMDRLASVVADRHSGHECVTASVDSVHFMAPAKRGETLLFAAAVNRSWNTSMEIGVRVMSENSYTKECKHIVSAYYTFVAVGAGDKPVPVPAVVPQTSEEKARFDEAQIRRDARLASAEQFRLLREKANRS